MPIMSNPNATARWSFPHDLNIPSETRPAVLVRAMTEAQVAEHQRLVTEAFDAPDNKRAAELIGDALRVGITGWVNMATPEGKPVAFNKDRVVELLLADVMLTDRELWTLVHGYPSAVSLSLSDLFRSHLPLLSDQATYPASAPTVEAASATTPQAPDKNS